MKNGFHRGLAASPVLLSLLCGARHARADDATCKDTYEQSQELMKPKAAAGSPSTLLPAREMLRSCVRSSCKDWVIADCSRWLGEVEGRIPSVVFAARNTAGRDLTDTRVLTPAGAEIVSSLDGHAVDIEPGTHTFVFVAADGARREKNVLVREGEKAQVVAATFDASEEELAQTVSALPRPAGDRPESGPRPLAYVGYGVGGLGLVGLGVGIAFGIQASTKKQEADCDATGACDALPLADAHSAADIATAGFIVGGVFLAVGVALVLFAPAKAKTTSSLILSPSPSGLGARF